MNNMAINTNFAESGFYAFDGIGARNIFYYIIFFNKIINKSLFMESLFQICIRFPKLRSVFVKGLINDKWEPIHDFSRKDLAVAFYDVEADDSICFERKVLNLFEIQKNIEIDISKEYPMKLFFYVNKKKNKCAMIYGFHHSFTDANGGIQLIKCIFEAYYCLVNNKKIPSLKNYYSLEEFSKELYNKYQISPNNKSSNSIIKPKNVPPIFNKMFKKNGKQDKVTLRSYNEVIIEAEKFKEIKSWSKKNGMTINDFIILVVLVLTQKYNKELPRSSDYIGTTFTVNTRKYIEQKPLMIGNFSGFENFIIDSDTIENKRYSVYCEEMKKFKSSKLLGLNFMLIMKSFDIIPKSISRPIVKKFMGKGTNDRIKNNRCISISNVGDLTGYLSDFKDIIDRICFISNIPDKIMPQLNIASYNDVMNINIVRENDYNGVTNEICKNVEQVIDEMIYS